MTDTMSDPTHQSGTGSRASAQAVVMSGRQRGAQWALPVILIVLIALFSIARPESFFTSGNLTTILAGQAVLIFVALGAMLPLIVGQFDLSVGANMAMAAVLTAKLAGEHSWPLLVAVAVVVAASASLGILNGLLIAGIGVDSFVATLAVSSVVSGLLVWSTDGTVLSENIPVGLTDFGRRDILALPATFLCVIAAALIIAYILRSTPTGRFLYAIGGSAEAARLSGINVKRLTLGSFAVGGLMCGLGGVFLVAKVGSANPTTGPEFLLPAFAACFLGATSIRPGVFNVTGTVLAVLVIAVGTTGLQMFGAPFYIQPIFAGLVLLVASLATRYLRSDQHG